MENRNNLTPSQIRYMVWLSKLSRDGVGVKNSELANALSLSKPSVHSMLKFLAETGIVRQELFGLAHLTEEGRLLAKQYEVCFCLVEEKMAELCGDGTVTENAICGILADMTAENIKRIYEARKTLGS